VYGKFLVVVTKTPMFQLLNGHYLAVRTVTGTCTYAYTCNTSVHIQCELMYEDSGARDVNCLLSQVQVFKVYTNLYSLAKSIMTLFLWLYKFTSVLFGYVCVHRARAQKLLHIYVCLFVGVAWFRNYMHYSTVNKVIKDVDFYKRKHGIAGCCV